MRRKLMRGRKIKCKIWILAAKIETKCQIAPM
jgi:hypothetical protein